MIHLILTLYAIARYLTFVIQGVDTENDWLSHLDADMAAWFYWIGVALVH
jgi:hypothetical protein